MSPDADTSLTPLYVMVGTVVVGQAAAGIVGVVKWLGSRTVEREDKDKEDLKESLKEHEDRFDSLEKSFRDMEKTVLLVQSDVRSVSTAVESIRATVNSLKPALDSQLDKQSEYYRAQMKELLVQVSEKLDKVEYDLRQDTTRAIHDAKMQLVTRKR